jgi:hypothetical protein
MKIRKEDLEKISENPIELFYQGIKSPQTKDKYTRTLRRIICDILEDLLHGSFEQRAAELVYKAKKNSNLKNLPMPRIQQDSLHLVEFQANPIESLSLLVKCFDWDKTVIQNRSV